MSSPLNQPHVPVDPMEHAPLVVEDPKPEDETVEPEEDGSSKHARLVAGPPAAPAGLTPSGRPMRPTSEEAYY